MLELQNSHEIVRYTTCWALSKYSYWIVQQEENTIFKDYLTQLLKMVGDMDSNVQSAACTAFALLIEANPQKIQPYIAEALSIFNLFIENYKNSTLVSLFDAIGTLA
mmetsp:Transcript_40514/g.39025  ORF Transcript_40514/g.39025 Transcript_40514/m.39025 type:complete len:107 (-) Transcript_40514:1057-1377(-)